MLFLEYDVLKDGMIEVVAVVEAIEEYSEDPHGEAWLNWRRSFQDGGHGCVGISVDELELLDSLEDELEMRLLVEQIILSDHRAKVVEAL